ncbi:hypothetical protein HYW41_01300 [Candidatus Daviesbacteria bacterium]|nr:hypothetical protein [Candidatus Daviesbacteria bacterium]
MKISLFKIYLKGKVLLTFKDLVFIITWLFMLVSIADAMHGQERGITIFLGIWEVLGFVYALKIAENYSLQKKEEEKLQTKIEQKEIVKKPNPQFFEA